jgi:molybdopterin-guanine dinucleotide biosynthesis protein B
MVENRAVPVLGFAAYSGTGKTTLLLKLLPLLQARGQRVGIVKHAHRTFEIDHTGKDSYALGKSGVQQIIVGSRSRWALICEHEDRGEPSLDELIAELRIEQLDLVLVEGFKRNSFPKIELHRPSLSHPLLYPDDENIVAIAHDGELAEPAPIAQLDINAPNAIADFVTAFSDQHHG